MPYPTPIVEIAFTDGPYVVSPTWTDVTAYVRGMEISRGTSDDWNLIADGSANVVLSNRDRRFDPFNASGPYFGNLLPRRQIRIRATSGGTTYDVFRGFIAGWPPEWTDAGYDSTVTLSCFDALQLLGSSSLLADWSRDYILSLNPRHYYPLDEPVSPGNSLVARDLGTFAQPITFNGAVPSTELASGLPSKSIEFAVGSTELLSGNFSTNFTASMWANFSSGASFFIGRFSCSMYFDETTDRYTAQIVDGNTSTEYIYRSSNQYVGGSPYMMTVIFEAATLGFTMYLNGSPIPFTVASAPVLVPIVAEGFISTRSTLQQLIVIHSLLLPAQVLLIYVLCEAIFGETTASRFNRLIGESPFPGALTSPPSLPASNVLDITNDAPTVSSELAVNAESEYAPLFVNKTGVVTQFNQNQIRSQTRSIVSQATYGGAGLPIGPEVQLQYDGDSMRNVANIQMSGGGVYIQTNSGSVTANGEAEQFVASQVATLADAIDIANIVTGFGGQVYAKSSPVQVVLSPNETWGSTLGLELWDRFTLNVVPRSGATITTPMLLTRINHSVSPERWSTTIEGSARWAAVFILNTSRLGGTDLLG
jgi:hypothetical protein